MIGAIARQGNRRVIAPFFSSNCSLTEVEMPTAYTTRPALNFDAPEPVVTGDPNASALFPSQPVYARTPKKKASNNLPLLVGIPVLAVAAGALIWGMSANRADAPTDPASMQTAVADSPSPATTQVPASAAATPAPIPAPTEIAANEPAPAPVARSATPRAAAPARPAARRAAPVTESAPDVSTASSNVSATVPATPPTVSAPIAEPAPLVIPPAAAPQPTPQADPSAPM
jgi:hypothetical protein